MKNVEELLSVYKKFLFMKLNKDVCVNYDATTDIPEDSVK